uniref:Putative secreted peptide n=1 Tax=Anopheles braziliensis TaxID=58242 RepID=A0A2M3ZU68_9DIPT
MMMVMLLLMVMMMLMVMLKELVLHLLQRWLLPIAFGQRLHRHPRFQRWRWRGPVHLHQILRYRYLLRVVGTLAYRNPCIRLPTGHELWLNGHHQTRLRVSGLLQRK